MYQQENSYEYLQGTQKRQMVWFLAAVFAVVIAAIAISAFLVNLMVQNQVTTALANQAKFTQMAPAALTTAASEGCVGSAGSATAQTEGTSAMAVGGSGGEVSALTTSSHKHKLPVGGSGAEGGSGLASHKAAISNSNSTVNNAFNTTKSFTKYVNSNNTIGSNNGSNNSTSNSATTNITTSDSYNQGSYNTSKGDLKQIGYYENGSYTKVENDPLTVIKPETNTKLEDSFTNDESQTSVAKTETNYTENHVLSDNTVDVTLTPPAPVYAN
jgi:hypothetical protein